MVIRKLSLFVASSILVLAFSYEIKVRAQTAPKVSSGISLPDVEATQKKVEVLKVGDKNVEDLLNKLKELGDPATRKDNESDQQYILRAERILKGRALYVHFAHQEMQRVLEAKFGAEMVLDDYDSWVKTRLIALEASKAIYGQQANNIRKIRDELGFDAVILAKLISDNTEFKKKSEEEKDKIEKEKGMSVSVSPEVVELRNLIKAVDNDRGGIENLRFKKIIDNQVRAEKYKTLSVEEMKKRYYDFKKKYKDTDFEFSYLSKAVIPENQKLAVSLPKAHEKILSNLKSSFESNKALFEGLDDRAVQLSVIAKYTRENLGLVSSIKDVADATDALIKLNNSEKAIKEMLAKFLSLPGQLSEEFVGKSLSGDVGAFVDNFKPSDEK